MTQTIDAVGNIHAAGTGRFAGHIQMEADADQLLGADLPDAALVFPQGELEQYQEFARARNDLRLQGRFVVDHFAPFEDTGEDIAPDKVLVGFDTLEEAKEYAADIEPRLYPRVEKPFNDPDTEWAECAQMAQWYDGNPEYLTGNEPSEAFPQGSLVCNINMVTGQPDFERLDAEGRIRPVLGYTAEEVEAALDELVENLADAEFTNSWGPSMGVMASGIHDSFAKVGCQMHGGQPQLEEQMKELYSAAVRHNPEAVRDALERMWKSQKLNQRIMRPRIDPNYTPPGAGIPRSGEMYSRSYGAKYDRDLPNTEIARLIRADIKAAQKAGWLPPTMKIRTFQGSGGGSINVRALGVSREWQRHDDTEFGWREIRNPEAQELERRLDRILNSYNHDGSEMQMDYHDVRYYGTAQLSDY